MIIYTALVYSQLGFIPTNMSNYFLCLQNFPDFVKSGNMEVWTAVELHYYEFEFCCQGEKRSIYCMAPERIQISQRDYFLDYSSWSVFLPCNFLLLLALYFCDLMNLYMLILNMCRYIKEKTDLVYGLF